MRCREVHIRFLDEEGCYEVTCVDCGEYLGGGSCWEAFQLRLADGMILSHFLSGRTLLTAEELAFSEELRMLGRRRSGASRAEGGRT